MIYDNLRPQSQDQIVWSSAENFSFKNITVTQVTVIYIWPAYLSCIWAFWGSQFTRIGKSERHILCQLLYVRNLLCTLNACGATPFEWHSSKVCCLLAALYLQSTVSRLKQQPLFCNLFSLEFAVLTVKSVNAFENISVTLWRSSHPAWLGFTEEDAIETAWSRTAGRFKNVSEISKIWVLHFHCVG